ncbi:F0F1 ATP synthase subunit B [Pseudotabrizicola sp. L79]|uniref:F0F1 ATP synthase subunit B n=1 Tax=Pseudotabrizicola sp. L79 TaxID=3118402 RepID=UPI0040543CFC
MIRYASVLLALTATPALAAGGPFFSLRNTDFVVLIAFLLFLGILVYFKVPGMIIGLLDKRATQIKAELEEARSLREEAKALLASFERKQKEVKELADQIVTSAKAEAEAAGVQAQADLKVSIARRLAAAEEQIAAAENGAVREVREKAISIAVAAAGEILAKQMTAENAAASIDAAITQVEAKLH